MSDKPHRPTRPPRKVYEFHRLADPRRGDLKVAATTTSVKTLLQALKICYPMDQLPSWGESKLLQMAEAESSRRKAAQALKNGFILGSPERKNVLAEIKQWQTVYDTAEKTVREYLSGKARDPTQQELRDEAADRTYESSDIGKKMKAARGE